MEREKDFNKKKASNSNKVKSSSEKVSNSTTSNDTTYRFILTDDTSYYSPNKVDIDISGEF